MYLAIDIGGTAIKYGLISNDGQITESYELRPQRDHGRRQRFKLC